LGAGSVKVCNQLNHIVYFPNTPLVKPIWLSASACYAALPRRRLFVAYKSGNNYWNFYMWFKNLLVYRFTKPFEYSPEELSELLAERAFAPCGSQDLQAYGWVPPLGRSGTDFVHAIGGYIMVCARRQEKLLPAAVVNEVVEDQVAAIEAEEGRPVRRKERTALKEDAIFSMLPKAFNRSSLNYAYIAVNEGLLVVNAASSTRAEELMDCLRDSLGSLPVVPIGVVGDPIVRMTSWLREGGLPGGFSLGHECELRDALDESGVIRARHQDLSSEDINRHVQGGMVVTRLGLQWQDRLECIVDEKLAIKRLIFSDIVEEKAQSSEADDVAQQFDIDFSIMTLELKAFVEALIEGFGGEDLAEAE
jgi:recombination associated protein RdgC